MRTTLLIGSLVLMSLAIQAQDRYNLVIFSEDGYLFNAYVNSVKQNLEPSANIRINDLKSPQALLKIEFADGERPDITKNFYFQNPNTEVTVNIKNTKKGLKLRYFGEIPLAQSQPVENEVVFSTTPMQEVAETPEVIEETQTTTTTTVQTQTTGIQTNTNVNDGGDNVAIDVNMGGVGFNMDVNVNIDDTDEHVTHTEIHTTTTTTTTTTGNTDNLTYEMPDTPPCPEANTSNIRNAMSNETFEDNKMDIAKQALRNKCLYTQQVIDLAQLFTFEDDKLDFVKFTYDLTIDQDEYYQVNSIFEFSSTKDELNEFLKNR